MSEQIPVELRVLGYSFRLATTEEKQSELEHAVETLNQKYDEFRQKAPRMEPNKLIIMVALELMQDVLALNKTVQEYEHCEILLNSILENLESESSDPQLDLKQA